MSVGVGRQRAVFACLVMVLVLTVAGCSASDTAAQGGGGTSTLSSSSRSTPSSSGPPLTGTWKLASAVAGRSIEGFADAASVVTGASVVLRVSARTRYHVEAYRMGYYGGSRAEFVWASGYATAQAQPASLMARPRRMVTTRWAPSLSVPTQGWKAGLYLLKLVGEDGAQSYVPLVVRAPTNQGAVLIVCAVGTWQAYNKWGGGSLYRPTDARRSRAVSFDRPYGDRGLGDGLPLELPLISVLEQQSATYAYAADLDLGAHPDVLTGVRAVVILGHSEYWTPAMRANVVAARDRGVSLAFLGANDVFWRARTEPGTSGADRVLVSYKDAHEDPVNGAATTVKWEDPPVPRPSNLLTGQSYGGSDASAAMVIQDPASWLLHGTGVGRGTKLPDLIGPEYDFVEAGQPTVAPVRIVAHSPVVAHSGPQARFADFTWYQAPSGAVVVDVGTMGWGAAADSTDAAVAAFVRRVTTNIVTRFLEPRR